jgi:ATP-dependent DNA helicase RecG
MRRLPTGFSGMDPPERWPRPRGKLRPERLEAPVESQEGVGPALKKRLAKLGLERVGDLLEHRPRRYEEPAQEKRISELWGEDEVVIVGEVLSSSSRRGRGRARSRSSRSGR